MTSERSDALVPQGPTGLAPASRLAVRTLAERAERVEKALVATRTLIVGPGGYPTISAAVADSREGDSVLVRPGTYEETVVVEGKAITIRGDGERDDIVVGWDQGPAFVLVQTRGTVTGLTIVGGRPDPRELGIALHVTGGGPRLENLRLKQSRGVKFDGGADGSMAASLLDDGQAIGIWISDGATPRAEDNDIRGSRHAGIMVDGEGTDPLVRRNRVLDGQSDGVAVYDGASPRIEENEVSANALIGIAIHGAGTNPFVRANRVRDGLESGIVVKEGASPRIEGNEVWANAGNGIWVDEDSESIIHGNRVHDCGKAGIVVHGGASQRVEDNEVWANVGAGIAIGGDGADPLVRANRVHDGHAGGIFVYGGASPMVRDNLVTDNRLSGIEVRDGGSAPVLRSNVVRQNRVASIAISNGARPSLEDNEVDPPPMRW